MSIGAPILSELPNIGDLVASGALFVANHSGGKDSQAMLIKLLEVIPRQQLLVVHACLGEVEWEGALELAQTQAANAEIPFIVARAGKTFFEMVEHRFKVRPGPNSPCFPSAANRQCTSDLKRDPIQREVRRWVKERGFTTIVTCLGIRAGESPGRARRPTLSVNRRGTISSRAWFEWLPIHDMTTTEVFATIKEAGQEPHWAYGAGNSRLSCVFCILASPRDIANGAAHRPGLLRKYVEMEDRTGYTMHQSRKPLLQLVEEGAAQSQRTPSPPSSR